MLTFKDEFLQLSYELLYSLLQLMKLYIKKKASQVASKLKKRYAIQKKSIIKKDQQHKLKESKSNNKNVEENAESKTNQQELQQSKSQTISDQQISVQTPEQSSKSQSENNEEEQRQTARKTFRVIQAALQRIIPKTIQKIIPGGKLLVDIVTWGSSLF